MRKNEQIGLKDGGTSYSQLTSRTYAYKQFTNIRHVLTKSTHGSSKPPMADALSLTFGLQRVVKDRQGYKDSEIGGCVSMSDILNKVMRFIPLIVRAATSSLTQR